MQAIARANRINESKNNGLIVDYIETYTALLDALAIYGTGGDGDGPGGGENPEPPVQPKVELIKLLEEAETKREGLSDEQKAIFDILRQGKKLEVKEQIEIKRISIEMLDELKGEAQGCTVGRQINNSRSSFQLCQQNSF